MQNSRTWDNVWSILRVAISLAIITAVVAQLTKSVARAVDSGNDVATVIANFFSFFTILSNVGSVAILLWAAIWFWTRGRDAVEEPRGLATALASVTTYMIVTGIVYNLLLRGIELPQGSEPIPWSNEILHVIAPIFLLLDLFLGPLRRRLSWGAVAAIIVFPIAWVVYTLVRGPLVTNPINGDPYWYPYPFLDPNRFENGYLGVSLYVVGIAAAILAVAFFVVWIGRWRAGRRAASADDPSAPVAG